MHAVKFINRALSNADTQRIRGDYAKIIKQAELGNLRDTDHLLPWRRITALYFTRTSPTTVSASTLTPTGPSHIVS